MWDYALLSKLAKECGGPEKLVEKIAAANRAKGRKQMFPWAFGAGVLTLAAVEKVWKYLKEKRKQSKEAEEAAAAEIVAGIKEYNRQHPIPEKGESGIE